MIGGKELNPASIRKHCMAKLFYMYIWNWNDQLVQWHHSEEQGENPFLVWSFKEGGPFVLILYPCFFPPHQAHCFRIDTPMNSNGGMIHMTRFAMERAQPLPSILGVSNPSPHEAVSDHFITLTGFMLLLQLKEVQWFPLFFFFPPRLLLP